MKLIKCLFFSVVLLLLATSCSKVDQRTEGMIPSDATVVVKVDVPQLIEHSGIEIKGGKMVFPKKFQKMLESESRESAAEVDKKLSKLKDSGIDFNHSVYVFMPNGAINDKSDFEFVVLVPVDNEQKLKAYIEDETEAVFKKKGELMVAQDGADLYVIKDGTLCITECWQDDQENNLVSLLSPDNSITDNSAAAKVLGSGDDVNIFMDSKKFRKVAARELNRQSEYYYDEASMAASSFLDMYDVQTTGIHISFADNECNIKCENEFEENSEFLKMAAKATSQPSAELIGLMPDADNALVYSLSIDAEAIAEFDLVKKLLGDAMDDPDFRQIFDFVKSIKGPVTFGVAANDFDAENMNFVFAAKSTRANQLHSLIGSTPFAAEMQRQGDEYVMRESPYDPAIKLGTMDNDIIYARVSQSGVFPSDNMSKNEEAKRLLSDAVVALYFTSTVDNMNMQCSFSSKDLKDGYGKIFVTEGGKKLCPLDALAFFLKLQEEVNYY